MEDTIFALLLREIDAQKKSLQEHLASGGAQDYAAYCRCVGEHSALQRIETEIKDLEKRFLAE